jgi:hypothetical protein
MRGREAALPRARETGYPEAVALLARILLALAIAFAGDALLFRTGWYAQLLEPDSSTANVERMIAAERAKLALPARYHVASVGDSRMGFLVRYGNERSGGAAGFRFGSLSLGGSLPRCWPYLLRAVDPDADRYSAIVIPLNDYDDEESDEFLTERLSDLHYLSAQLRLSDLVEFPASHMQWPSRWHAFRAILFKGFAYQNDLRAFLEQPRARLAKVRLFRGWEQWVYDYRGETRSLAGMEIDPLTRTARYPAGTPEDVSDLIDRVLKADPIPYNGLMTAYRRQWLGKIVNRYRGSRTQLIFIRLPRVPIPLPVRPVNPHSAVRQFAREPHVTIVDEAFFDSLSKPELFMDLWHLNRAGSERFSIMLSDEVRRILTRS